MEALPIDDILPQLLAQLRSAGAVVLKAEPGAGKTTRVPPAILDAGLANLGKKPGQIVVLQPRRAAARAAAVRMSDERGTALGADIGYQVRHEGRTSKSTRILVCTEGLFLRRLQEDPLLEDFAVVVFDEFHERSVDSDLAFALTAQVRRDLRPDLKIVVMSATLDGAPIAAFLGDCQPIECAGRTFPVDIEHLKFSSNLPIDKLAADGVKQVFPKTEGNVLVFLPGLGEIRKTEQNLEQFAEAEDLFLSPLYGDMPLNDQIGVLRPSSKRKIVLATNVAETSLTIGGVTAVVDTGYARINKFDPSVGLNRLELSRISRASAAQRAGRAGRTAPGQCLRLWTEKEQFGLSEFEMKEIDRIDLSECVLQLLAWGESDLDAFPWFEAPPKHAVKRALELLDQLDAIRGGKLTALGRAMSRLPLQPRFSRLLLEGASRGQVERACLCAALLSERSPFRKSDLEKLSQHHTDSDVLEEVRAIEAFQRDGTKNSIRGEVIPNAAKQILRTQKQLSGLVANMDVSEIAVPAGDLDVTVSGDDAILLAIMSAFPDRICKRRQAKDRKGVMVAGRGVVLGEQSQVIDSDLFVAVDLVDLNRAELIVRSASYIDRSWLPASHLRSSLDVEFDREREKVVAFQRTRFCDLLLDEKIGKIPADVDPGAVLAQAVASGFDLSSLIDETSTTYLNRILFLKEWLPELDLPDFGPDPWQAFLPIMCSGCVSVDDLRSKSLIDAMKAGLTFEQTSSVDKEAPEFHVLPNGRRVRLQYEAGKAPVLAARIQELFGMAETPRVARKRVSVVMHLLAPNYRVQQITHDLKSFWTNTYPEVKKELKGRYPKHKWPDNPLL